MERVSVDEVAPHLERVLPQTQIREARDLLTHLKHMGLSISRRRAWQTTKLHGQVYGDSEEHHRGVTRLHINKHECIDSEAKYSCLRLHL
jgi:hypothetical protein